MKKDEIATAIMDTLQSVNEMDSNFESANIVDALFAISRQMQRMTDRLGVGDANTRMGALENLAKELRAGLESIASAIREHEE